MAEIPPGDLAQLEREAALKKVLFRRVLQEEGEQYMKDPKMVRRKGTLLNVCYEFTMACPLVRKRGKSTEAKMDEFIILLPALNKHVKAGTKQNIIAALTTFFIGVFVALKRTKLEQTYGEQINAMYWEGLSHDDHHSRENEEANDLLLDEGPSLSTPSSASSSTTDASQVPPETKAAKEERRRKEREATKAKRRRWTRMRVASGMVMGDMVGKGGASRLLSVLRGAKTTRDLPFPYSVFVDALKAVSAPHLPEVVEDPAKVEKLKSLHAKLPEAMLVNLFRFTNPLKLVTGLSHLLLMSPFGTRSLLQRIMVVLSELSRTEREQKEVADILPAGLLDVMLAYIDKHYPFDTHTDNGVVERAVVVRALGLASENDLPNRVLLRCTRYFSLEIRRRQKTEYIEVIESPQILSILKHLFPVLQEPIMDMYTSGDIPKVPGCGPIFFLFVRVSIPSSSP